MKGEGVVKNKPTDGKDVKNLASSSLTITFRDSLWLRNPFHELVHLQKPGFNLHISLCKKETVQSLHCVFIVTDVE